MRILFHDFSTDLDTVKDLERKGRGGRVGSLFKVSDYLAWRGHKVTVISDIECTGFTKHGVNWDHEAYGEYDCLVTNRGTGDGYPQVKAKSRILWTHDLPHSGFIPEPKTIRGFDATVFMSRYGERVWRAFYRDIGKSVIIPNGVSPIFHPRDKDPDYLIFASAGNRGADKLEFIFDCIRERIKRPGLRLHAYTGESLHPGEGDYDHNRALKYGFALGYDTDSSSVTWCDPVPQKELAQQLGQAGLMIMPTCFPEICSNIVLQSLSCGTPIITTGGMGATPEWVKHKKNGMLTEFMTNDYMVHIVEMVRNACTVLENEKLHRKMIKRAAKTRILSWKKVGERWESLINRCA